jgi:anthranilate phosphoribosyltransferase
MIKKVIKQIVAGRDLGEEQADQIMDFIMQGNATPSQIGAFMAGLASKGETFAELAGAARAMRRRAVRVQALNSVVVDTCGTGGDSLNTFNISTTAAFVVAGCGVTVAKHGNRSVSSLCGSADVLEALGVNLNVDPEITEEAINTIGIGFLFAPKHHGAMKHAALPRKEVGIRSIFNMLGPLTNPAGANCQLLGVYAAPLTEMFAHALKLLGARRAFVVHGHDGMDEISICAPTRITELFEGSIKTYDVTPEQLTGKTYSLADIAGGDAKDNAAITRSVLSGKKGPCQDIVAANAGAALVAAGRAANFNEGIQMARSVMQNGQAQKKLEQLADFTRQA